MFGRYAKKLGPIGRMLKENGRLIDPVWRGDDMTAELFANFCERYGMRCTHQELINWANRGYLIDSMSIFTADKDSKARHVIVRNPGFMDEVNQCRREAEAAAKQVTVPEKAALAR